MDIRRICRRSSNGKSEVAEEIQGMGGELIMHGQEIGHSGPENYYRITLRDCATPAFCSFDKRYIGTQRMLLSFADALRRDGRGFRGCIKIAGRITDCCKEKAADAYGKECTVSPVEAVHVSVSEERPFCFEHVNVWDWLYYIQAQKAAITRLYYRASGRYFRAIGLSLYRPFYGEAPDDLSKELGNPFWAYPGVLYKKDGWLRHRLMYEERLFTDKAEMDADIAAPAETDYQRFFDDVFGDG